MTKIDKLNNRIVDAAQELLDHYNKLRTDYDELLRKHNDAPDWFLLWFAVGITSAVWFLILMASHSR